jgi:phosphatidylglycerophosphatase A
VTRLARIAATVGHIGVLPRAAAMAALAAVPAAWLLHWLGGSVLLGLAAAGACAAGCWGIRTEFDDNGGLGTREMVIAAVTGQWVALIPLSVGLRLAGAEPHVFPWPGWVSAFAFFGLFRSWKPWPGSWAARRNGPAGVMLHDVVAGAMAAGVTTALAALAHGWLA